jgi:protein ImuA
MPDSPASLARLKRRLERLERPRLGAQAVELVSLGPSLDTRLGGGIARQALHEVVSATPEDAASACAFALMLAWRAARDGKRPALWVTTDTVQREQGRLYGPGLAALGADPDRLILIHAPDELAALSAAADIVRAIGVAAMVVEAGAAKRLDLTASRRLALATAQSGVMGLVLRGPGTAFASAASTRWLAAAAPSTALAADAPGFTALRVELLRHRGGIAPFSCILEWDNAGESFREPPLFGRMAAAAERRSLAA